MIFSIFFATACFGFVLFSFFLLLLLLHFMWANFLQIFFFLQITIKRGLQLIAALSQCKSPEDVLLKAAMQIGKHLTRTKTSILVCKPKNSKFAVPLPQSELVLWGIDETTQKKFIVSGKRPGFRECLATQKVALCKVPQLSGSSELFHEHEPYHSDEEDFSGRDASAAAFFIPFAAIAMSKPENKRQRKKQSRRVGGGFDVDLEWSIDPAYSHHDDSKNILRDASLANSSNDRSALFVPGGVVRIQTPWTKRHEIDVPAVQVWASFVSCALTLVSSAGFGGKLSPEKEESSNKIFRLLEKELETALVERDGYRNRVRDLEVELAESFMACERATWQLQGLLKADEVSSSHAQLYDADKRDSDADKDQLLKSERFKFSTSEKKKSKSSWAKVTNVLHATHAASASLKHASIEEPSTTKMTTLNQAVSPAHVTAQLQVDGGAGTKSSMRPASSPKKATQLQVDGGAGTKSSMLPVSSPKKATFLGNRVVKPIVRGAEPQTQSKNIAKAAISGFVSQKTSTNPDEALQNTSQVKDDPSDLKSISSNNEFDKSAKSWPHPKQRPATLSGEAVVERALQVQDELRAWRDRQDL